MSEQMVTGQEVQENPPDTSGLTDLQELSSQGCARAISPLSHLHTYCKPAFCTRTLVSSAFNIEMKF